MEERWYYNPRLLEAAYKQYGSFEACAEALGGADHSTLARWWRKHGLAKLPKGPKPVLEVKKKELEKLYKTVYG